MGLADRRGDHPFVVVDERVVGDRAVGLEMFEAVVPVDPETREGGSDPEALDEKGDRPARHDGDDAETRRQAHEHVGSTGEWWCLVGVRDDLRQRAVVVDDDPGCGRPRGKERQCPFDGGVQCGRR